MHLVRKGESPAQPVTSMTYAGRERPVRGVQVQWLSQGDVGENGKAGYGLRVFTMAPEGEIPIHAHAYAQTIYVLEGTFECWTFEPETEKVTETCEAGPGEAVFVEPWEPHGMRNASPTETGRFLCCIGNWCHQAPEPGSA